jgi:hypothetical protein
MENTSGFYSFSEDQLLYAPNAVYNKNFTLKKENKDEYAYPVEGWYWFDSKEEAIQFFEIEENKNEQ